MKSHSRGAPSRPSYAATQANKRRPDVIFVRRRRWWARRPSRSRTDKPRHCEEHLRRSNPELCAADPGLLRRFAARNDDDKNERKAERRKALFNNRHALTGTAHASGRARLSAFHHGTCGSDRTPPLSVSHATSWVLVWSARPDGSKDGAHRNAFLREADNRPPLRHSRALPAPCCPSPARLHPQTGHDAGRACLAQAARERR